MIINKFDLIDALVYANELGDVNMFISLEQLLMGIEYPTENLLVTDEKILQYIEKVHESSRIIEEDISSFNISNEENMLLDILNDKNEYQHNYNSSIVDFYEDGISNKSRKKVKNNQKRKLIL